MQLAVSVESEPDNFEQHATLVLCRLQASSTAAPPSLYAVCRRSLEFC